LVGTGHVVGGLGGTVSAVSLRNRGSATPKNGYLAVSGIAMTPSVDSRVGSPISSLRDPKRSSCESVRRFSWGIQRDGDALLCDTKSSTVCARAQFGLFRSCAIQPFGGRHEPPLIGASMIRFTTLPRSRFAMVPVAPFDRRLSIWLRGWRSADDSRGASSSSIFHVLGERISRPP